MKDEGKYSQLWMSYTAVINVLMKKTENESQKLQLYKHEFEHCGHRKSASISFSLNIINGRAQNIISTTAIARDLWRVLDNNTQAREFLKNRKIRFSIDKSLQLRLDKIESVENEKLVEISE